MTVIDLYNNPPRKKTREELQETLDVSIIKFFMDLEQSMLLVSAEVKKYPEKYRDVKFLTLQGQHEDLRSVLATIQDEIHDIRSTLRKGWFS